MKAKITLVVFVVVSLFLAGNSQAVMHRVTFNAWTQTETGQPDKLVAKVDVYDDALSHPPDFVSKIEITAPDGTVFTLKSDDGSLQKCWRPWDESFIQAFVADNFVGKVIPGGRYKATVTPEVGSAITEVDDVAAKFLAPPSFIYPTAGQTGVPQTPTLKWTVVPGATSYRIILVNLSWTEPVYHRYHVTKSTDFDRYKIPPGDLKPNCNYWLLIEANSGGQELDMRSRAWINFTTGSW